MKRKVLVQQISLKAVLIAAGMALPVFATNAAPVNSGVCDARAPADIVFVVDISGSADDRFEDKANPTPPAVSRLGGSKIALGGLLTTLAAVDRVGLVSYADNASFNSALTFDKQAVSTKLFALTSGINTDAPPAIRAATTELLTNGRPGVRKIIMHVSDGYSQGGPAASLAAASAAKAAGIEFYAFVTSVDPRPGFVIGRAQMAQQASDAAHFVSGTTSQALYDGVQLVAASVHTKQLLAKSSSFTIAGTGLLSLVNLPLLVNPEAYNYDESQDPALVSAGGSNQIITVPLNVPGTLKLDLGVIKNSATGTTVAPNATAAASSKITGLELGLLGTLGVLKADAVTTDVTASYTGGVYSSTASLTTVKAKVLLLPLAVNIAPNTAISVPLVASLVLNYQPAEVKTATSVKRSVAFAKVSVPLIASTLTIAQSTAELSCQ